MRAFAAGFAKPGIRPKLSPQALLTYTARFWFCMAVAGQLAFVFSVASFYSRAALRGNMLALNTSMTHGYIPGQPIGNAVVAVHLAMAVFITIAGALQLTPQIRRRAPVFHRWNGRFYIVAAFAVSSAGLYMVWVRGTGNGALQNIGISLNAVLIMVCAALALRYAVARDFKTHQRWALRLFIVVGGVWFLRVGVMLVLMLMYAMGYDPSLFDSARFNMMSYLQYLLPLGVLELYLQVQDRPGAGRQLAMAGGIFLLTLVMAVGIIAAAMEMWVPKIETAFAPWPTLDETLARTILAKGVDAAVLQYKALAADRSRSHDFGEQQLNNLGYELLRARRYGDATRIFQLNVQAYPRSANTYDSLGEADMDAGNKALAISNYQQSLVRNPRNLNAVEKLQSLRGG